MKDDISHVSPAKTIAVACLVRGAERDWLSSCERFIDSYRRNRPGIMHSLYVIFTEFVRDADLIKAKDLFHNVCHSPVFLDDNSFDIGAYIEWANMIEEELICVFNTASEILAGDWLRKFAVNLMIPNVGLVGATASYERFNKLNNNFLTFPNIHIRSNAFMIDRALFCRITQRVIIASKIDAFHFESGSQSLTRQVLATGKDILLVGRNGRGYSPKFWATSDTFRQGRQTNLLVADNQTRKFLALPWNEKKGSFC